MWLDKCLKSLFCEDPSTSNMVNWWKHCSKLNLQLYHIYWSLWKQLRFKKSLWLICNILGLFVNLLNVNNMYSLLNRDNLLQHFQMHLSEKRKIFSDFFFTFSKFRFNFEHFPKKGDPHDWCIFELTESEKRGQINV